MRQLVLVLSAEEESAAELRRGNARGGTLEPVKKREAVPQNP